MRHGFERRGDRRSAGTLLLSFDFLGELAQDVRAVGFAQRPSGGDVHELLHLEHLHDLQRS